MTLLGNLFGHLFGESASEFEARGDQFASINNWRRAHSEYERALQKTARHSMEFRRLEAKLDEARLQSFDSLVEDIHSRIDVREFTFAAEQIQAAREIALGTEQLRRLDECEQRLRGAGRYEKRLPPAATPAAKLDEGGHAGVTRPAARLVAGEKLRSLESARLADALRSAERDPKQGLVRLLDGMPPQEIEARTALGPRYQKAALALAAGDPAGAVDQLTPLRGERPESAIVFYDLGAALQGAGRFDDAVTLYVQRLELFPDEWQTWYDLAQALWRTGERDETFQVVQAGVARCPRSGHLMAQWGVFLVQAEQPREALEKFYLALQLDEFDDAGLYHTIATVHQELGEDAKARRAYLKALELQPRSIGTQLDYAEMLLERDEARAAQAILETAFRSIRAGGGKRVYRAYASYLSSRAHLVLGEREMALLAVSRALEDNDQPWLISTLQAQRQAVLSV